MSFMLFSGLTKLEANGQVSLSLSDSICVSEDLTVYTFTLKETFWNDGEPLTAQDFERSWKEALHPDFPCFCVHNFFPIKNAEKIKNGLLTADHLGVHATNEKTLVVELEHPLAYFLELTAFCPFFPVPKNFNQSKRVTSNGPFQMETWEKSERIVLSANPHYWGAKSVKLHEIHISFIEDQYLALKKYEQNELDFVGDPLSPLPAHEESLFIEEKKICPVVGSYFCAFNCDSYPFHNHNMRRAFFHLIPRNEITDGLTISQYKATTSPIPGILYGSENQEGEVASSKKALFYFKKALKELGISKEELSLEFLYEPNDLSKQVVRCIKQEAKELFGIDIEFVDLNFKGISDRLLRKDYQIALSWWLAQYKDPMNFFERFKYRDISKNYSGWESPQYIQTLDRAVKTQNKKKRIKVLEKAEKIFMSDYPIAPILDFHLSFLQKPYLKGVTISPIGSVHFERAQVDHVKKERLSPSLSTLQTV